jgi:hypothetical protein
MPTASEVPVLHCPTCYSTEFQISRARPEDRLQIWMFKRPVRCRKCNFRTYASRSYAKWLRAQEDRQASIRPGLASSEAAE